MRNFYKVLGIAASADDERIKSAFRTRVKAVHPDVNPGNKRAEALFIELVEAYEVLRYADTRASYDTYLTERRRQSRRRLFHCAGLMTGSFAMTTASALFAMSLAGADVPLRESWRLALAALLPGRVEASAVVADAAVSPASPMGAPIDSHVAAWQTRVEKVPEARELPAVNGATHVPPPKTTAARKAGETRIASAARTAPRRVASATAPRPPTPARQYQAKLPTPQHTAEAENWWPWSTLSEEQPYYGLGAKGL